MRLGAKGRFATLRGVVSRSWWKRKKGIIIRERRQQEIEGMAGRIASQIN
jgi:hypothetical protein